MLIISENLFKQIVAQCKRELPNEACGILAGKAGRVEKIYEMNNIEKSPVFFSIAPQEQLKVIKDMRGLQLEMLGIYHSHVASQAYPSKHDVELAYYPDVSYAILSLKVIEQPVLRSFKIKEGQINEEELCLL